MGDGQNVKRSPYKYELGLSRASGLKVEGRHDKWAIWPNNAAGDSGPSDETAQALPGSSSWLSSLSSAATSRSFAACSLRVLTTKLSVVSNKTSGAFAS